MGVWRGHGEGSSACGTLWVSGVKPCVASCPAETSCHVSSPYPYQTVLWGGGHRGAGGGGRGWGC